MARKRITVIQETDSGRNTHFVDNYTGEKMSRTQFVKKIEEGKYSNYHIRKVNGLKTPAGNPDNSILNNLG